MSDKSVLQSIYDRNEDSRELALLNLVEDSHQLISIDKRELFFLNFEDDGIRCFDIGYGIEVYLPKSHLHEIIIL